MSVPIALNVRRNSFGLVSPTPPPKPPKSPVPMEMQETVVEAYRVVMEEAANALFRILQDPDVGVDDVRYHQAY